MITILSTILNTISILLWMHLLGNIEYRHKHPTILVLTLSLSVAIINYTLPSVLGVFWGILLLCISVQILFCGKWWTLCIHALFAYFYVDIIDTPVRTLLDILSYQHKQLFEIFSKTCIANICDIMFLLLFYYIYKKTLYLHLKDISISSTYYIIGILIGIAGSFISSYSTILFREEYQYLSIVMYIMLSTLTEFTYILGLVVLFSDVMRIQYRNELYLKDSLLHTTRGYYHVLENQITEIRKIKHEMKQHFLTLDHYMETQEYEKAQDYIQKNIDHLSHTPAIYDVGNDLLNATITHIQQIYHIPLICQGSIPLASPYAEDDLCIIIANLLENAMEYCQQASSHLTVTLAFRTYQSHLIIHCENPIEESIDIEHLGTFTSKSDTKHHGFGIQNIKDIVTHYNGTINFDSTNHIFIVDIIL